MCDLDPDHVFVKSISSGHEVLSASWSTPPPRVDLAVQGCPNNLPNGAVCMEPWSLSPWGAILEPIYLASF